MWNLRFNPPVIVYHGSVKSFSEFKKVSLRYNRAEECGYHFGAREAARKRLVDKILDDTDLKWEFIKAAGMMPINQFEEKLHKYLYSKDIKPTLYTIELDVKHPLRMEEWERFGTWTADDILPKLFNPFCKCHVDQEISGITDEEIDNYLAYMDNELEVFSTLIGDTELYDLTDSEKCEWIIEYLDAKGFDAIVYDNKYEGGGDSYIVFDVGQISIVKATPIKKDALLKTIVEAYKNIF